jgi:hypothetical protein
MSKMTEEQVQAGIAEFKKKPQQVQATVFAAFALGIVTFLRILARAYAMDSPMGKAVANGCFMLIWFLLAASLLQSRSRLGFFGLFAMPILPLLGLFASSVHLIRLTLEGTLAASWPETIHCLAALTQLATTGLLFRYLLAKQVRDFVWKPKPNQEHATGTE